MFSHFIYKVLQGIAVLKCPSNHDIHKGVKVWYWCKIKLHLFCEFVATILTFRLPFQQTPLLLNLYICDLGFISMYIFIHKHHENTTSKGLPKPWYLQLFYQINIDFTKEKNIDLYITLIKNGIQLNWSVTQFHYSLKGNCQHTIQK